MSIDRWQLVDAVDGHAIVAFAPTWKLWMNDTGVYGAQSLVLGPASIDPLEDGAMRFLCESIPAPKLTTGPSAPLSGFCRGGATLEVYTDGHWTNFDLSAATATMQLSNTGAIDGPGSTTVTLNMPNATLRAIDGTREITLGFDNLRATVTRTETSFSCSVGGGGGSGYHGWMPGGG